MNGQMRYELQVLVLRKFSTIHKGKLLPPIGLNGPG